MIAEGFVFNQNTARTYPYIIRRISSEEKIDILRLQDEICVKLSDIESYHPMTSGELENLLREKGMIYGLFVNSQLVGCAVLYFPGNADDNLALDLPRLGGNLDLSLHLEAVLVHPNYRGNGIQKTLFMHMLEYIKRFTDIRYVYSTVSPGNLPSIKSLLSLKLVIADLKIKYNDCERYILFQDLLQPIVIKNERTVMVSYSKKDSQLSLFNNNYVAFRFVEQRNELYLMFGKNC